MLLSAFVGICFVIISQWPSMLHRLLWFLVKSINWLSYDEISQWQIVTFEACHLFRELQETYQFSGLLAKCQFGVLWEYYITGDGMNINEMA